ncbi:TIGR03086 family metal-binding protein [Nonomuraea sp. NEAU-A123]|uniref:TIGR03086 family metal-binding protein n=1 Tax=Nonomuraea sp. NEAU-A123 TaxID=2839649 RepID=UPI001BE3F93D|nr:TIGR03086 family metal-binding protein [Nonomuraea sp. NEAU-A123]MBT2229042.1 TIGR03086 family protein [Nonomuraea sp. NEAU-A123]
MTSIPVERLGEVCDATERLIAQVRDEQWAAPTPCTEWNVRDLVNHLVAGNRRFAGVLRGAVPPGNGPRPPVTDVLGDDPLAAFRDSSRDMLAAFNEPGVLDKKVSMPIGTVPGVVALQLRIVEGLVHGWDLARAMGQTVRFPDDLVEQALAFTRDKLADVPPDRSPFGAPTPVSDDAPALDRLVAFLGRPVTTATD